MRIAQYTLLNVGVPDVAVSPEKPRARFRAAEKLVGIAEKARNVKDGLCVQKNCRSDDPHQFIKKAD